MTRPDDAAEKPARPRGSRTNLVVGLVEALRKRVSDGDFGPGDKLPSESQLIRNYGVSRTVIREAIAGLRADGLVEPRQGAGVFVLPPQAEVPRPFQIVDLTRISSIIEMLELRAAVEMEAAALAAGRRSPAQDEAIGDACAEMVRLAARGCPTTAADLAFHLAIADATNNPRFREFLEVMGLDAIPRAAVGVGADDTATAVYVERIAREHGRVAQAISRSDPDTAREAMQVHLKGSQERYRDLAQHQKAQHVV